MGQKPSTELTNHPGSLATPGQNGSSVVAQQAPLKDDVEPQFDFSAPSVDINQPIRWEEADFIKKTDDGSQGVLFVNIKGCGVVVLKSSMCLAGEVFSTIVAREMNIPGPQMRIVEMKGVEGKRIKAAIRKLSSSTFIRRVIQSIHIVVMEFLHGKTLLDTRREQLEHFFAKSEQKECILRSLGGLAALDVFLNNTDRIPLIASNDGNGGNIMFSSQDGSLISLDNGIVSLRGVGLERYIAKVKKSFEPLIMRPHIPIEGTRKISKLIELCTGLDIGENGMISIQQGIVQGVCECVSKLNMENLRRIRDLLRQDGCQIIGFDSIQEDFLQVMLTLFRDLQSLKKSNWDHQTLGHKMESELDGPSNNAHSLMIRAIEAVQLDHTFQLGKAFGENKPAGAQGAQGTAQLAQCEDELPPSPTLLRRESSIDLLNDRLNSASQNVDRQSYSSCKTSELSASIARALAVADADGSAGPGLLKPSGDLALQSKELQSRLLSHLHRLTEAAHVLVHLQADIEKGVHAPKEALKHQASAGLKLVDILCELSLSCEQKQGKAITKGHFISLGARRLARTVARFLAVIQRSTLILTSDKDRDIQSALTELSSSQDFLRLACSDRVVTMEGMSLVNCCSEFASSCFRKLISDFRIRVQSMRLESLSSIQISDLKRTLDKTHEKFNILRSVLDYSGPLISHLSHYNQIKSICDQTRLCLAAFIELFSPLNSQLSTPVVSSVSIVAFEQSLHLIQMCGSSVETLSEELGVHHGSEGLCSEDALRWKVRTGMRSQLKDKVSTLENLIAISLVDVGPPDESSWPKLDFDAVLKKALVQVVDPLSSCFTALSACVSSPREKERYVFLEAANKGLEAAWSESFKNTEDILKAGEPPDANSPKADEHSSFLMKVLQSNLRKSLHNGER